MPAPFLKAVCECANGFSLVLEEGLVLMGCEERVCERGASRGGDGFEED